MPVAFNFVKQIDLPSWHWLNQYPGAVSSAATANCYDGSRYIYFAISTPTQLWRFDTWSNAWQFMASLTASAINMDIEHDGVRNVIWIAEGNGLTGWRFFNLNSTAITFGGQTVQPFLLSAAIIPALTGAFTTGGSISMTDDLSLASVPIDGAARTVGVAATGSTTTTINDAAAEFQTGLIGCYVRFITGVANGQSRVITAAPSATQLTTVAFSLAPAAGDTFVIEVPGYVTALATTSGSLTTLVATGSGWPVNVYRDSDAIIVAGTGAGQRRRIASNTVDTLTLAAVTTGNPRTGPWATAPDATSTFRIVPSSDFLYEFVGTTTFYRADIVATTITWTAFATVPAAPGGGSNSISNPTWAPFSIVLARGIATATVYRYDVGLQTWTTLPSAWGAEVLTTGGTIARVPNRPRLLVHISASSRMYHLNVVTGILEPVTSPPYIAPTALEGKRVRVIRAQNTEWVYFLRAGGVEFFRLPVEWV